MLKIEDLTQQLECANELRIRTEQDFGNFRVNSYNFKRDLSARENKMREFEVASKKEIKREIKEKFKRKMEAFEKICTEKMRHKIEEAEHLLKE